MFNIRCILAQVRLNVPGIKGTCSSFPASRLHSAYPPSPAALLSLYYRECYIVSGFVRPDSTYYHRLPRTVSSRRLESRVSRTSGQERSVQRPVSVFRRGLWLSASDGNTLPSRPTEITGGPNRGDKKIFLASLPASICAPPIVGSPVQPHLSSPLLSNLVARYRGRYPLFDSGRRTVHLLQKLKQINVARFSPQCTTHAAF